MTRFPERTRRSPAVHWIPLLALCAAISACVTNPVTGRPEISLMSPEREVEIGRQEAQKVEQQIGLVRTPALVSYVERIGARVAARSPRTDVAYRFHVADMPEPNAFALPGGYIYVSRGLLALTNSEDELAGVIGHEIGHVAARHSAQRQTRAMGVGFLSILGVIAGTALGGAEMGQAVGQLGQVAGAGLIAAYGRDQERQADEVGQTMAAAAGYAPRGITEFLRTLGRDTELKLGKRRLPTFLDSHPVTEERVRTTSDRAAQLAVEPIVPILPTRDAFFSRIEGLLVGPDPAEGVFEENLFLHPGLDLAIAFPPGWNTANQATMVGAQHPEQMALVTLEAESRQGDPAAAGQAFFEQVQLRPDTAGRVRVGRLQAYRAMADVQTSQGPARVEWVWIAHPRGVFKLTALAPPEVFDRLEPQLRGAIRSFHVLSSQERARVMEQRLAIVRARAGESLAELCRRSGSAWSVEEVAVANGLLPSDRLKGGFPIKVTVARPYRP